MTKTKPIHEIRLGKIKAAIWENSTENGVRHNVTLNRLYRNGESWGRSDSFGRDDLPVVAKITDLVYSWLHQQARPNEPKVETPHVSEE